MPKYREINIGKVKTIPISKKKHLIRVGQFGSPVPPSCGFHAFLQSLPSIHAGNDLNDLVRRISHAIRQKKPVLAMMGGHVIKVGLSPIMIDLMANGFIQGIAVNGAGIIHDIEFAYFGRSSEDVSASLKNGSFGMVKETAEIINHTVRDARTKNMGFGEALGKRLIDDKPKNFDSSILGQAFRLNIPVTVHVAVGTDIVHQHPSADGASIGELSMRDFRIFAQLVSQIHDGGVVLLFGSSVILPEVFYSWQG